MKAFNKMNISPEEQPELLGKACNLGHLCGCQAPVEEKGGRMRICKKPAKKGSFFCSIHENMEQADGLVYCIWNAKHNILHNYMVPRN